MVSLLRHGGKLKGELVAEPQLCKVRQPTERLNIRQCIAVQVQGH